MKFSQWTALTASLVALGCQSPPLMMVDPRLNEPADSQTALVVGREFAAADLAISAGSWFRHAVLVGEEEQLRHEAYIELYLLGVKLFDPDGEQCQLVDLNIGCGQVLFGCANELSRQDGERQQFQLQVALGPEPEALVFGHNQVLDADVAQVALEIGEQCQDNPCRSRATTRLFSDDQCQSLVSVQAEVALCVEEAAACTQSAGQLCQDAESCLEEACALGLKASRQAADWPEVVAEASRRVDAICASCESRDVLNCELVFADSCTGRSARICEYDAQAAHELLGHPITLADGRELLVFEDGWDAIDIEQYLSRE
ncbi:MAG: hypothetical protein H0U74_19700 [Bradymonadaceae bacterium]|nr:hypothetical protein [Lujinxingiaceae bacterium]